MRPEIITESYVSVFQFGPEPRGRQVRIPDVGPSARDLLVMVMVATHVDGISPAPAAPPINGYPLISSGTSDDGTVLYALYVGRYLQTLPTPEPIEGAPTYDVTLRVTLLRGDNLGVVGSSGPLVYPDQDSNVPVMPSPVTSDADPENTLLLQLWAQPREAYYATGGGQWTRGAIATGLGGIVNSGWFRTHTALPPEPDTPLGYATRRGAVFGLALATVPVAPFDASPLVVTRTLGRATHYDVFITGPDYRTIIDSVGWSQLSWQRILDETSEATVTIPDSRGGLRCMTPYGGLRPWRYGMRIERDGQEVWSGPVVGIARPDSDGVRSIKVTAKDALIRYRKRLAVRVDEVRFESTDAGAAFQFLVRHARYDSDHWLLPCPNAVTGAQFTRTFKFGDLERSGEVLDDLMSNSVDAYVHNGRLRVFQPGLGWLSATDIDDNVNIQGPSLDSGDLVYGMFANEHFVREPGWSMNGLDQVNTPWVAGADSGQEGFRRIWSATNFDLVMLDGVLDEPVTDTLYSATGDGPVASDEAFQQRAYEMVALRGEAPLVIQGTPLSHLAPVTVEDLRPGSIWRMDVQDPGFGQLLTAARLKAIDVEVEMSDGVLIEQVSPTLYPHGGAA